MAGFEITGDCFWLFKYFKEYFLSLFRFFYNEPVLLLIAEFLIFKVRTFMDVPLK